MPYILTCNFQKAACPIPVNTTFWNLLLTHHIMVCEKQVSAGVILSHRTTSNETTSLLYQSYNQFQIAILLSTQLHCNSILSESNFPHCNFSLQLPLLYNTPILTTPSIRHYRALSQQFLIKTAALYRNLNHIPPWFPTQHQKISSQPQHSMSTAYFR